MTNDPPGRITIDCHAHIFDAETELSATAWTTPAGAASAADYRATMAEFRVSHAVLAASSLHADNGYAIDATRADKRWRTTIIASPETDPDTLRAFAEAGACGIRLQLRNKPLPDLRAEPYRTFLRHIADLGWHVQLHDDAHRLPPMIAAVEESGAALVVDHFGRPGDLGAADPGFHAVLDAVRRGRTWVKLSGAFRLPNPSADRSLAEALLDVRGPDRLLWGSDWPFVGFEARMTYRQALRDFVRAVPDAGVRSAIDATGVAFYFRDELLPM